MHIWHTRILILESIYSLPFCCVCVDVYVYVYVYVLLYVCDIPFLTDVVLLLRVAIHRFNSIQGNACLLDSTEERSRFVTFDTPVRTLVVIDDDDDDDDGGGDDDDDILRRPRVSIAKPGKNPDIPYGITPSMETTLPSNTLATIGCLIAFITF